VLVHGGGGTAFPNWVKLWNSKGFAAIAMDTCGATPCWHVTPSPYHNPAWPRHEWSGPGEWGNNDILEDNLEDQWPFHAVGAVLNAFELLKSYPQVDANRIGVSGVSWGGVLTCLAASLEDRFRFAIPVYGCGGFDTPMSSLMRTFSPEQRQAWFGAWDPALYLAEAQMPFLWLSDTEDVAFPLDVWNRSTSISQNPLTRRSLRIDYPHGHDVCWPSKTIPVFAKGCLENATFPLLAAPEISGNKISCTWTQGDSKAISAELAYTRATGHWGDRRWRPLAAQIQGNVLTAELPPNTQAAFLQLRTEDGCRWTSPVVIM
jgi:dienelactone hydrolase